nr:hypothetical protein [Tanacetum cinerariifolium]
MGDKDYAENAKNQSKTRQYQHEIGSQQQKPDQQALFSKQSSNEAKKTKESSLGSNLANDQKHLFEMVSKEEFNTCAFFNPTIIQGHVCDQESNFSIKHILATVEAHKEKEIFLASYLQEAFNNSFKWTMLECKQQVALWECGYYVMKFVFETLYIKQKTFPHQLHDSTRALRKDELDGWIINAGS